MSHDPYAPRGARRVTVGATDQVPGREVPGNEREVIEWLIEPVETGDREEAARRADEAEARETVRGGSIRAAVLDTVSDVRRFVSGDAQTGPDTVAVKPDGGARGDLLTAVPDKAADVVAWVENAPVEERRDYAVAAWETEQGRASDPRKSVRAAVAELLDLPEDDGDTGSGT